MRYGSQCLWKRLSVYIICTYHYYLYVSLFIIIWFIICVCVCDRNYKRSMEYLFYVPDPEHSFESDEILQIPEKGFKTADAYKVQNS